ncbi:MAG: ferric reductase-like transmembrane domain-containing protein [Hyphomicrobiales bacterium]|nr:ferric reductase-like transmembrane domain-containing protein [Hyphomicrobiales bacterium]
MALSSASSLALWRDRRGRVSRWRIGALTLLALPVVLALHAFVTTGFGARPINDLIHRTGYWALVFLLVTLAVTPATRIWRLNGLVDARRMLGVGVFVYAALHILLFVVDQMFDLRKVATEIALRLYLTIGFVALLGLAALAATSTDAMVRRLGGRRWQRLHQLIYGIALLALIHFFQQTKADVWVPTFAAGLFVWLMGYRLLAGLRNGALSSAWLMALAVIASVLVFAGEAIGIALYYKVSPLLVLQSTLEFDLDMIRPGWLVLGAGLGVVIVQLMLSLWPRGAQPAATAAAARVRPAR